MKFIQTTGVFICTECTAQSRVMVTFASAAAWVCEDCLRLALLMIGTRGEVPSQPTLPPRQIRRPKKGEAAD